MRTTSQIPLEENEQKAFVRYCQLKGYKVHHCANEIGGSTKALKLRAIKAKQMGTSKGFPDLLVFVPIYGRDLDEPDAYQPMAIEMKRKKGSSISVEQRAWGEILKKAGVPFKICYGCDDAIKFVEQVIKGEYEFDD